VFFLALNGLEDLPTMIANYRIPYKVSVHEEEHR